MKDDENPTLLYRATKPLPYELREHCTIYFEEGLYSQALNLLFSLLTAGTSSTPSPPAFLPPPQHLALAATLVVHPALTTRAKDTATLEAANTALRYLRLVADLVGPINGNLQEAFAIPGAGGSLRRGGGKRRRTTGEDASPTADDENSITTELANAGGIWARVDDFWQVVGWALNCSVVHKKRWERWSLWLEYMVGILEQDWEMREKTWAQEGGEEQAEDPREGSMIVKYLNPEGATSGKERRILRAIFADGDQRSLAEFPEIWENETKERKKPTDGSAAKKISTKVNVELDNYGDYLSSSSSPSPSPPPQTKTPPPLSTAPTLPDGSLPLGGPAALHLRLRLLSLLSTTCATLPSTLLPLHELYTLYLSHIRPTPLPTFFHLISLPHLTPTAASTLTQHILRSLLATSAPLPQNDDLNQDILETNYLPYPANTASIADNAKVSLCVEMLLRLWDRHFGLVWSEELAQAAEAGIEAREAKVSRKGGRRKAKSGGEEEGERMWLNGSAERIRGVVEMAQPS